MTTGARTITHPLDPLSADEIAAVVAAIRSVKDPDNRMRFVSVTLQEPAKEVVGDFRHGAPIARAAEVVLLDPPERCGFEALVDVHSGELLRWESLGSRQPALMPDEYFEVEQQLKADPRFQEAIARRGLDLDLVRVDPVPPGAWGDVDGAGRRLCRALAWVLPYPDGNQYARPIEGLGGTVDLHTGEVLAVEDPVDVPIASATGEYRAALRGSVRLDLRPVQITQPEGASFAVDGNSVRWQKWSFRVGWTAREGLVLHTVGYEDGGRIRSVLHRASFCEMAVPYGDPTNGRHVQCPFDIGENLVGTLANSLELGCDCLGLIHYFDAHVVRSGGDVARIANAICLHEEDDGILWKHWDFRTDHTEVRRSRRLVVSFIASIGNYDYGFYWYLYQDGTIEAEVKATGIVHTRGALPGTTPRYGQLVAPGVDATIHQHFFNARLDFDLDGTGNAVYEVHSETVPIGGENPHGNAFRPVKRLIANESDSPELIDPLHGRYWLVVNRERLNAVGEHVGYKLMPGENVLALCHPESVFAQRGAFAYKHFWATRFDPSERYAAGDYPNQSAEADGLPRWVTQSRSVEDEDLVIWYSFGLHHLPRPEDWPVMPVARIGFSLKPFGFFDENPALDVPPTEAHASASSCHA
jgi:primary-amine oxidase